VKDGEEPVRLFVRGDTIRLVASAKFGLSKAISK